MYNSWRREEELNDCFIWSSWLLALQESDRSNDSDECISHWCLDLAKANQVNGEWFISSNILTMVFPIVQEMIPFTCRFFRREFQVQKHLSRDIQLQDRCLGRFYRMDSDMFDSFQIGTSSLYAVYHLIDFGVIGTAGKKEISRWTTQCRWHTCLGWRNFVVSNIPLDPPRVLYKHRLLQYRLSLEIPRATDRC